MKGEWIRKPTGSTSVVFVHGIVSSGETAWTNSSGVSWPQLLSRETTLAAVGIYVYTYQTAILSGSYSLDDAVDDLKERLVLDELINSKRLIFVCHSMGGLVVRKFLVERRMDLIDRQIEIGLFLVASPSLGASYAQWLSLLARALGQVQVDALRFNQSNLWLNSLDKEFINLKESGRLAMKGKELIEDKLISADKKARFRKLMILMSSLFWRRPVVERFTGARYFGEPYKVPGSDHQTISKPHDEGAIQHRLLCSWVKEMTPEEMPQKTLVLIDDEPAVREAVKVALDRIGGFSLHALAAVSSRENLDRFVSQLPALDGAIVDLDVPPGGIQLYGWLKAGRSKLPVVFYTRHADRPDPINRLLALGIDYRDIFLKGDTGKDIHSIVQRFQQLWTKQEKNVTELSEPLTAPSGGAEDDTDASTPSLATVAGVGACLREFSTTMPSPHKWTDIATLLPGFGEIREREELLGTVSDCWRKLPQDEHVRVVLLRDSDGLVLRWWADEELAQSLMRVQEKIHNADSEGEKATLVQERNGLTSRIITHTHLASYGPQTLGELRSGYIQRSDDRLEVYGGKGKTTFDLPPKKDVTTLSIPARGHGQEGH